MLKLVNSWQIICNFLTVYLLKLYYLAMIAYLGNKMHKYSNQCSGTSNKRNALSHSDHTSYIEFNYFLLWTFSPLLIYPHEYDNSVPCYNSIYHIISKISFFCFFLNVVIKCNFIYTLLLAGAWNIKLYVNMWRGPLYVGITCVGSKCYIVNNKIRLI